MTEPKPKHTLPPRGMSRAQAAAYVGVAPGTFDRMVDDGLIPPPLALFSRDEKPIRRQLWDRKAIDLYLDRLSGLNAQSDLEEDCRRKFEEHGNRTSEIRRKTAQ